MTLGEIINSRNQDSGKVFFLEKQEYVDRCETYDIQIIIDYIGKPIGSSAPGHRHRARLTKGKINN